MEKKVKSKFKKKTKVDFKDTLSLKGKKVASKTISSRVPKKKITNLSEKKTIVNKTKKPAKKDKWHVWLKNNIIENERKYSKQYRFRRVIVSLFSVFCFLVVLFSVLITDFSNSYRNNKIPYFTFKKYDEYNQVTKYFGLFYKIYICDNGKKTPTYIRITDKVGYCEIIPKYDENDIFINPNKVKISKSEVNIIKNYYFDNYIYFKSEKEVQNAYKISNAINKVWYIKKEVNEIINNDETVELAVFGKVEKINGIEEFKIQYNDPNYYKCIKQVGDKTLFSKYNYKDNTCESLWNIQYLDKESCKLIYNSTEFIKDFVKITNLCK